MHKAKPSILWYDDSSGNREYVTFIGVVEEQHEGTATISKYPVQNGFEISNHMIRHNRTVKVKILVPEAIMGGLDPDGAAIGNYATDIASQFGIDVGSLGAITGGLLSDPVGTAANYIDGAVSVAAPVVGTIAKATDRTLGWFSEDINPNLSEKISDYVPSDSRRIDMLKRLEKIQENGTLCSLSTTLRDYSNLVLTRYNSPTTIDTYSVAVFDLTFEEVIIVDALGNVITNLKADNLTDHDVVMAKFRASHLNTKVDTLLGVAQSKISDFIPL